MAQSMVLSSLDIMRRAWLVTRWHLKMPSCSVFHMFFLYLAVTLSRTGLVSHLSQLKCCQKKKESKKERKKEKQKKQVRYKTCPWQSQGQVNKIKSQSSQLRSKSTNMPQIDSPSRVTLVRVDSRDLQIFNVQHIDLKLPLLGRGVISNDLKSISTAVRYSTTVFCLSPLTIYIFLESTLIPNTKQVQRSSTAEPSVM